MSNLRVRFLNWVARKLLVRGASTPYKHLWHADGRPYMFRYWLLKLGRGRVIDGETMPRFGGARLHLIESSDDDRAYHDHPWWFVTIILSGGYIEHRPGPPELWGSCRMGAIERWFYGGHARFHGPGSILFRRARDWHRLEIPPGGGAVTLFIFGRRRNDWGYLVNGKKVPWREFEGEISARSDTSAPAAEPAQEAAHVS